MYMMFDEEFKERKEKLKWYFKRLGEAINDTLTHSQEVQEMLSQIRGFGFGVDLSMVIGLGLYSNMNDPQNDFEKEAPFREEIRFELTPEDMAFLQQNNLCLDIEENKETL